MNPTCLQKWVCLFLSGFLSLHLMGIQQCQEEDADGDGWTTEEGDCDDTDDSVHPGADEVCDGKDNNCNGRADEDVIDINSIDVFIDPETRAGDGIWDFNCGNSVYLESTLHLEGEGLLFKRTRVREAMEIHLPRELPGIGRLHPHAPKILPALDKIEFYQPDAVYYLAFWAEPDNTWSDEPYGWMPNLSTLFWPYACAGIVPCNIDQGDSLSYRISTPSQTSEGEDILVTEFIDRGAIYQPGINVGNYTSHFLGIADDGTNIYWDHLEEEDAEGVEAGENWALPHFNKLVERYGSYQFGGEQQEMRITSAHWCMETETCAEAGIEQHPRWNISKDSIVSYGDTAPLNFETYYGVETLIIHEDTHAWGVGGLQVVGECWADTFAFIEGWTSKTSTQIRAEVDGIYTEEEYRILFADQIDYYINHQADIIVWPEICTDDYAYTTYSVVSYARGGLFWYFVEDAVGQDILLQWENHFQEDYRGMAFSGDILLNDFYDFTGIDLWEVPVVMKYSGEESNLVDGSLRTVNDYPESLL